MVTRPTFRKLGDVRVAGQLDATSVPGLFERDTITIELGPKLRESLTGRTEMLIPSGIVRVYRGNGEHTEPVWERLQKQSGMRTDLSWWHCYELLRHDSSPRFRRMMPSGTQIAFQVKNGKDLRAAYGKVNWERGHSLGYVPRDKEWTWFDETRFLVWMPR